MKIGKRDLTTEEKVDFEITAKQYLNGRPMIVHCDLARKFAILWTAYEVKCEQLKWVGERR